VNVLTIGTWIIAAGLGIPAGVFCAQVLAALLPRKRPTSNSARPRVAVLTPAHDEEQEIAATLHALRSQLREGDAMLVVADNCTDATADTARAVGAEVLERQDDLHRGKGYALAAGIGALAGRAYDVLIVLDADCRVEPGAIDMLASQVQATSRPAQAIYLMDTCGNPTPRDRVSTWAFMVKNLVRPLGLSQLGLPCPLTGTGMAFPRHQIEKANLATGNIVEDMQLGLDLALAGHAPRLCPGARVTGRLPPDGKTALRQRRRWEHGHLHTLLRQVPRLLCLGLARWKPGALSMALDLMIPPLSLFAILLIGATILTGSIALLTGNSLQWLATAVLAASLAAVVISVLLAWMKYGRQVLGIGGLLAAIAYVLWKIPMYVMFLFRPEKKWVRTPRGDTDKPIPESTKPAATT
jgi:cellulose synthase/poly-beta-1,6-N-acetylglucosamine synthase-like glycosyltransferase